MSHSRLYQMVRLAEMLKWWRRKALKKAHSFSDVRSARRAGRAHTTRSLSMPSKGGGVPAGHLAVYVGEDRQRFVIKTSYLSHPLFRALLKKTEEEMGFHHEGALAIPCQVPFFEHILQFIHSSKSHSNHSHHHHPLPPQFHDLLRELLHLSSLDPTHHLSFSTFDDASLSLCNLTRSLSSLDVSNANGMSQVVLV
ncbi:hypothetical protein GOP47_0002155 [Adiantum capillus-veneris]|uniref:Uncharacterized protein n=1 Tax=Adiantum capillus-veneris TaxID=13818 RepID=A0A9D4VA63_ADICA|nr:hypothetical protein GOP47_0002155 [Adiantum capillus-veneris]